MILLEDQILNELDKQWEEYSKNLQDKTIQEQYAAIIHFYDSVLPDVDKDGITTYAITKAIIISHLKNEVIDKIMELEYKDEVAKIYNSQKK